MGQHRDKNSNHFVERVPISRLAYYDESQTDFVVEPLEYEVFVGAHSLDAHGLRTRFVVRKQ